MSNGQLKALAERIERLMDERDGIQSDIRDIYTEAKSAGFVPKVLRKAITRKRMDPDKRNEEDTILDLYEDALSPTMRKVVSMAKAGASSHQIEAETGVDHATVARSVALNKKSATETDRDADGVITETAESPPDESCGGGEMQTRNSTLATEGPWPVPEAKGADAHGAGVAPGPQEPIDEGPSPEVVDLLERTMALPLNEAAAVVAVVKALSSDPWDSVGPMPAGLRRAG